MRSKTQQDGLTLLITLLIMGLLLVITASLLHITLKQFQFSGISEISEISFYAANAGMECALYYDLGDDGASNRINAFAVPGDGSPQSAPASIACVGAGFVGNSNGVAVSGDEQRFRFSWGDVCTDISVYKFYDTTSDQDMIGALGTSQTCTVGIECTVLKVRGYNTGCGSLTNPRVVERELTLVY